MEAGVKSRLPSYVGGHTVAIIGVVALHSGIATWAMQPDPPAVMATSQAIQVSMVAPSVIREDRVEPTPLEKQPPAPEPIVEPTPVQPPEAPKQKHVQPEAPSAPKGMVKETLRPFPKLRPKPLKQIRTKPKATFKPKPNPAREPEPSKRAAVPQKPQQVQRLTSGVSRDNAKNLAALITKPVAASYLKNPPPLYPMKSRMRKQQGTVLLDVRVSADGRPMNVSVRRSSGHTLLDRAALEAVQQWMFVPARHGSNRIEANVEVPVTFQLR